MHIFYSVALDFTAWLISGTLRLVKFNVRFFGTVPSLPRFVEPLNNATVVAGREVQLSCAVENLQKFKVRESFKEDRSYGNALATTGVIKPVMLIKVSGETRAEDKLNFE